MEGQFMYGVSTILAINPRMERGWSRAMCRRNVYLENPDAASHTSSKGEHRLWKRFEQFLADRYGVYPALKGEESGMACDLLRLTDGNSRVELVRCA